MRDTEGVDVAGNNEILFRGFGVHASYDGYGIHGLTVGPSGFKYNPGTVLNDSYRGFFFLAQFPVKLITAFRVREHGASYDLVDDRSLPVPPGTAGWPYCGNVMRDGKRWKASSVPPTNNRLAP